MKCGTANGGKVYWKVIRDAYVPAITVCDQELFTNKDLELWNQNALPSYNCDGLGNCTDPGDGTGTYSTLQNCQNSCPAPTGTLIYHGGTVNPSGWTAVGANLTYIGTNVYVDVSTALTSLETTHNGDLNGVLDLSGNFSSLNSVNVSGNLITSADISNFKITVGSQFTVNLSNNALTSITANGTTFSDFCSATCDLSNNQLSSLELNGFFTSISSSYLSIIDVSNNPGTATCNPSIATAKNYAVITGLGILIYAGGTAITHDWSVDSGALSHYGTKVYYNGGAISYLETTHDGDLDGILDLSALSCSSIIIVNASNNLITSANIYNVAIGTIPGNIVNLSNNSLTSVLANVSTFGGNCGASCDLSNNQLSDTTLNNFFTSLGSQNATIDISGNPGTATCDVTIATGKGYTVITGFILIYSGGTVSPAGWTAVGANLIYAGNSVYVDSPNLVELYTEHNGDLDGWLDLSAISTSFFQLDASGNLITSVNLSGIGSSASGASYDLHDNNITTIIADGSTFTTSYHAGCNISSNLLDAVNIDSFFSSIGAAWPLDFGIINISSNPGTATCTPSIATAKNYTVITGL